MNRRALSLVAVVVASATLPAVAHAALWKDVTAKALGTQTGGWTNKVELGDLDGDGRVDVLFANGGNYNEPGDPEQCGIWFNVGQDASGVPKLEDRSMAVLGDITGTARVIKAADIDGDGSLDLVIGHTYHTQSRLLLGEGDGTFRDATDLLPQVPASTGDVEVGDMDDDGDLDLVLSDWGLDDGEGGLLDPFTAPGGRMLLWRNDLATSGKFTDATSTAMPDVQVAWSWEHELVDVDGDFDLDVLASCKVCKGSFLLRNQGGKLTHVKTGGLPQFTNNYDFEPMFLTLPGQTTSSLAVVTINDGTQVDPSNQFDLRERVFVADAKGKFTDETATLFPDDENVGFDDNMATVLDFESDGDPDVLIGALGEGDDRLMINDLAGAKSFVLSTHRGIETGLVGTPGTLGIMVADLNDDGRPDVVQSQGELADPEKIYIGDEIAADTAAPIVRAVDPIGKGAGGQQRVRARIHDNKSPVRPHDYDAVEIRWTLSEGTAAPVPMRWMGEFMFSAVVADVPADALSYVVCAIDAAGNEGCSDAIELDGSKFDDVGEDAAGDSEGGCAVGGSERGAAALVLLPILALATRRRRGRA
jgi:hypothetical protein